MKNITLTIALLLSAPILFAQNSKIITSGKIEYEKRINMYTVAKREMSAKPDGIEQQLYDQFKMKSPKFITLNSTLEFNNDKMLFTPIEPETKPLNYENNPIATQFNTIYTNLATSSFIAKKAVYNNAFVLKDSLRKITWRLTDETQQIAGFTCRRANGLVQDSLYAVAFYTDRIWVSGGPESFGGLPGMILKVALPYEDVIWTATKVTEDVVPPAPIVPPAIPKNGKTVTYKQLNEILKQLMKTWGQAGAYEMKIFSL